jgi:hypothetical protein
MVVSLTVLVAKEYNVRWITMAGGPETYHTLDFFLQQ